MAVAETDHQDLWQRATLTAALTGGSLATLTAAADKVERWLEARCPDGVHVRRIGYVGRGAPRAWSQRFGGEG